jgi:predicted nucleotidyltransferase
MDVSRPYRAVSPGLEGDVLVTLAGTTRPMSGRMIARRAKTGSQEGVRKALARLVESGLVQREESDGVHLHWLNRGHVAAGAVMALAGLRTTLIDRLREEFARWDRQPAHASLFGSAARSDGGPESDLDIFLVRPRDLPADDPVWHRCLGELPDHVRRLTGNALGLVELDEADLPALLAEAPPVLSELRRDAIDLAGAPLRTVLGEARGAA